MSDGFTTSVPIGEGSLTVTRWGAGRPEIVLLHDGLGSIGQWRSVPSELAARTGRTVAAYDRSGHGRSTPVPGGPWPADWLHREASVLAELLRLIAAEDPVLVGHSDGASIALIHAAEGGRVSGVVSVAAHSWVEQETFDRISALRTSPALVIAGLSRHHSAPAELFEAWSGAWVSDQFRAWDVRPMLPAIDVPVLVAQGTADEYATDAQATLTAESIGPNAECRLLPDLGHLVHHEDPDIVVALAAEFVESNVP